MRHIPWVSFDGKDCSGCKYLNERGYCEFTACIIPCTVRATIPEVKPRTNGDNFRAMTDEELARTLFDVSWAAWRNNSNGEGIWTEQDWLDWLNKECE